MYRIDDPSASATLPVPEAALTEGYWTEGNPGSGIQATLERASWFNMVQEELRAIPVAAGIVPSKVNYNQLLTAMKSMFASVVGSVRNLQMSVSAASATATMTADEIIVETALGGQTYRLASFNKTINLATTGAGGMDTGTAPTSGWVGIYAIYNPTTQTAALLATAETAALPSVYGGANMPAGYTASALVSAWQTNASKLLTVGYQRDRHVNTLPINALTNATGSLTPVSFSIAGAVPKSAIRYWSNLVMGVGSGTTSCNFYTCATAQGAGIGPVAGINAPGQNASGGSSPTDILTPQTSYYIFGGNSVQTPATNSIGVNGYDF